MFKLKHEAQAKNKMLIESTARWYDILLQFKFEFWPWTVLYINYNLNQAGYLIALLLASLIILLWSYTLSLVKVFTLAYYFVLILFNY